ncbi:MAG TPA: ABC transporter ATP-binding protein [Acidimicrobiales bacterium]|jgi:ATP-binding cassette subfamily B protein
MRDLLRNLLVMLRASWRADRRRSLGALITTALVPLTRPLRAIGLGVLADGIIEQDMHTAVMGAVIVAALTGANRLLDWASVTVRMRLREHTILFVDEEVIELATRAPSLEHYERPEHQDQMELLRSDRHYLVNPFMPIAWSLAATVQVVATIVVFAALHPILAFLPLAGVPALILSMKGEERWHRTREESAQDTRLGIHLMELATLPEAGKEVRIFDLGDELTSRYRNIMRSVERRHAAVDVHQGIVLSLGWALFAAAFMAAVAFVVDQVLRGELSAGAVVLTLSLGAQINSQLAELADYAAWFSRTARAVGRYRWLMNYVAEQEHNLEALRARSAAPAPARLDHGIGFEDVSFAYPGTSTPVLSDVDLHLPAGSTVAIVGENGAGKTTLVKLLLRFYEPTGGRITVDGADLTSLDIEEWRQRTSGAFQDFARFQLLARHSVGVGSVPSLDDEAAVGSAIGRAAAGDLHRVLPLGLSTMLGREFADGVELSIGQWQKVAIARAMMRTGSLLLVLDEPTASLDAQTEHDLFDHFTGAARLAAQETGAITLLISHRFSTVRSADLVVVVADNRVAESGHHDALIDQDGLYAELYNLQAQSYR